MGQTNSPTQSSSNVPNVPNIQVNPNTPSGQNSISQADICADPRFDAGLVVDDDNDSPTPPRRYLFRGQHVMPYLFWSDPKTIVWQNITLITDMFTNIPSNSIGKGIKIAFEIDNQVYLTLRDNQNEYLRFSKDGNRFRYVDRGQLNQLQYVFFNWKVETVDESGQTDESVYYFIDSPPDPTTNPLKSFPIMYVNLTKPNEFTFNINLNNTDDIVLHPEIFPNIFMYKELRIPTQFDAFYKTKVSEIIFFRGHSACVSFLYSPTIWEDSEYCRSFVDTRTIIGCTDAQEVVGSGPEVNPNEPEDIEPDF